MTSITMKTKTLRGALSGVARSVAKNGPMPILATCCLTISNNSVTLTTTNLETTSSFTIECEGEGSSAACIDHGQLLATVSALTTETLTMVFGENSVTLKSGDASNTITVTIPSLNEEDFPRAVAIDTEESEVESAALIRAFERAILTVATDQLRPTLTGVFVRTESDESESDHGVAAQGRVVVASSDGFRMTVVTIATTWKPQECIIPAGFVNELIRLAESDEKLTIRMTDRIIEASTANQRTSGRLIDGKFPNINVIINRTKEYPAILMDKSGFLAAARLCRLYVNKSAPRGTLTFDRMGTLTVQATGDQGSVVQHLAAESESNNAAILDRVDIGLNLSYLETAIKGASGAQVTMAMASAMDPVVVRENDAETYLYQHVIMPMSR